MELNTIVYYQNDGRGLVPHFYFACFIHLSLRHIRGYGPGRSPQADTPHTLTLRPRGAVLIQILQRHQEQDTCL